MEPKSSTLEESSKLSVVCGDTIKERLPLLVFGKFVERFREIKEEVTYAICLNSFKKDDEIRDIYKKETNFNVHEAKDSLSNQNQLLQVGSLLMQVDDECSQLLDILFTK